MSEKLMRMLIADVAIVAVCLFLSLFFGVKIEGVPTERQLIDPTYGFGLMTIAVGLITFFGILDLPGGVSADGGFTTGRVRFALTATLVVIFVVFFGTTAYWSNDLDKVAEFPKLMVGCLSTLLSIIIPFYFGTTAAIEIFKDRSTEPSQSKSGDIAPVAER